MPVLEKPTFTEALRFWLKLGCISFGGPAGQIAIMHTEVVERRRWVDEPRFLHALNCCMLLPGPEAQQLATYLGWMLHGARGGIAAGALFVLPSALLLWALSYVYMEWGSIPWLAAVFRGLEPAVLAIVLAAVLRVGRKALKNRVMWLVAGLAFISLFFFSVPFVYVVLGAGLLGALGAKMAPRYFPVQESHGDSSALLQPVIVRTSLWQTLRTILVTLSLWWLPVLGLGVWLGWDSVWFQQGIFFSKAALVTFGGAYAVLPYVAEQAVENYGWLSAPQMMSGLALAESTPGPLIMVLQFVGFVGAWQNPAPLSPLAAGTLGALVTTSTTFVPSFLFILAGAPYLEGLRRLTVLRAALATVTAAVVGVILNLALWFGLHTISKPTGIDWITLGVALVLFYSLLKWKLQVVTVVALGAGYGLLRLLLSSMS